MKISNLFIFCLLSIFFVSPLVGQNDTFSCGSEQEKERLLMEDEAYKLKTKAFETYYQSVVKDGVDQTEISVIHTIPVVVHIIHDNAPLGSAANPTDAMVQQEIAQATERFRHSHANGGTYSNPFYGADSEIEFCLAGTDPTGSFTTGIVRYNDGANSVGPYTTYGSVFNQYYAWDTDNYCNLFIMTDLTNAAGVYMGGFDFTIYDSNAFWEGLIAHEIGHYLSLAHTFNGCTNTDCTAGGDFVCDTPPKDVAGYNGGSCAAPANTCTTDEDDTSTNNPYRPTSMGGMGDQVDMLVNYMDYTGGCWDAFSEGQKTRMKANINANRQILVSNTVCNAAPILANDAGIHIFNHDQTDVCDGNITLTATLKNYGSNTLTSTNIIVALDGNTVLTYNWAGSLASQEELDLIIIPQVVLSAGSFQLSVRTNAPNGVSDGNPANDKSFDRSIEYLGGGGCDNYQSCSTYNPNSAGGPGNITTVTITESFPTATAGDQISLCVSTEGDNSFIGETFDVYDENGVNLGQTTFGNDCGGPAEICFTITATMYNNWISNGVVSFDFDPVSTAINPNWCNTNQACATIYLLYNSLPVAPDFYSDKTNICTNEIIQFIDFSNPVPTNYAWSFSPNTVTFMNGTNANSANPLVRFNSGGLYTVSLNASNGNGGATETKVDYISVALIEDEDFESLSFCSNGNDCELTVCPLGLAWDNQPNGTVDDIDWRVDFGGTWSSDTGPDVDHNPGTATGIYLYLEASSCYSKEAHLTTNQCFSIPSSGTTELSFWYHMYGSEMGSLHVDVNIGGTWINDITPSISGDQGNIWHNWLVDLSNYAGQSIGIRIRGITGTFWGSDMAIDDITFNYVAPLVMDSYYPDNDNDGYGDANTNPIQVPQGNPPPSGYLLDNTDCDDNNGNVFPGNTEVCDGFDNNCNTQTDEGFDMDNDNIADCFDNCPNDSNNNQANADGDNYGDICDCNANNPNDTDMNIHNNPIASNLYQANNSISSYGTVPNNNTVVFQAAHHIDLKPSGATGFIAAAGSDFTAKIESCGTSPSPLEILDETEVLVEEDVKVNDDSVIIPESANIVGINVSPNPFRDNTNITLTLQETNSISLGLYGSTGQLQLQILDFVTMEAGSYNFELKSESLENGLYYVVLRTERETLTRKVIVIK